MDDSNQGGVLAKIGQAASVSALAVPAVVVVVIARSCMTFNPVDKEAFTRRVLSSYYDNLCEAKLRGVDVCDIDVRELEGVLAERGVAVANTDAWGQRLEHWCLANKISVSSRGSDGIAGTDDDIVFPDR